MCPMVREWTTEEILSIARAFQPACVLAAGADWGVFDALTAEPATAETLAGRLGADARGMRTLLDALAAMGLAPGRSRSCGRRLTRTREWIPS